MVDKYPSGDNPSVVLCPFGATMAVAAPVSSLSTVVASPFASVIVVSKPAL
jgi:hypothetical protein